MNRFIFLLIFTSCSLSLTVLSAQNWQTDWEKTKLESKQNADEDAEKKKADAAKLAAKRKKRKAFADFFLFYLKEFVFEIY